MRGLRTTGALVLAGLPVALIWLSLPARAEPRPESSYSGVAPGSNVVPVNIAAQPGAVAMVTWPGFQMREDGGSRVFIQTSVRVEAQLKREAGGFEVFLPDVSVPPGNARLALDTSFFNTPVKSVRAKPVKGKGVSVKLEMRSNVTPTLRIEQAKTGYFFVYVDFEAGQFK